MPCAGREGKKTVPIGGHSKLGYHVIFLFAKSGAKVIVGSEPLERFKILHKQHLAMAKTYQKEAKIVMMDQEFVSKKSSSKNLQSQSRVLNVYLRHIDSLYCTCYVTTLRKKILAFNILGVVNWYLRWYRPDGKVPTDAVFDKIIYFILYGSIGSSCTLPEHR